MDPSKAAWGFGQREINIKKSSLGNYNIIVKIYTSSNCFLHFYKLYDTITHDGILEIVIFNIFTIFST